MHQILAHSEEFRCVKCGKLLAKKNGSPLSLEIKCLRCGSINSIFKAMKDQVIITDKTGKILYFNELLEEVTGFSAEEALGKTPALWGGQMSDDFYKEMWDIVLNKKRSVVALVTNKRKDGVFYDAMLRISPIRDAQGDVQLLVGIETVITDNSQKHINNEIAPE